MANITTPAGAPRSALYAVKDTSAPPLLRLGDEAVCDVVYYRYP